MAVRTANSSVNKTCRSEDSSLLLTPQESAERRNERELCAGPLPFSRHGHRACEAWLMHLLAGQGCNPDTVAAGGDWASLLQRAGK